VLVLTQVVHCDLKPSNILLNQNHKIAKIGDVGLARVMVGKQLSARSKAFGTFDYCAPEVLIPEFPCTTKVQMIQSFLSLEPLMLILHSGVIHAVNNNSANHLAVRGQNP
jgi:serine/threonine protein kinase